MKYSLKKYIEYNDKVEDFISKSGTIFNSYEFLISVGSNYSCYCVFHNDIIIGSLPIVKSSKYKVNSLNLPPLTYLYGPVVLDKYNFARREILELLLDEIQNEYRIDFKCFVKDGDIDIYKKYGFETIEMISHVFQNNKLYGYDSLSKSKKRDVKKLNKLLEIGDIKLTENKDSLDEVLKLWKRTSEYSNFKSNIESLRKIINSGISIYVNMVVSSDGTVLSGAICPYDDFNMYHLVSASNRDVEGRLKEANTLSLYSAIKHANSLGLNFDFEGSNIEGVARFYKSMGGENIKVYNFVKINSIFYKTIELVKKRLKVGK